MSVLPISFKHASKLRYCIIFYLMLHAVVSIIAQHKSVCGFPEKHFPILQNAITAFKMTIKSDLICFGWSKGFIVANLTTVSSIQTLYLCTFQKTLRPILLML